MAINKTQKHTPIYLPHDLIAKDILSRLPVKSLLRFKAVSKQWNATISDPKFGETHLRRSKSSCKRLLAQHHNKIPHFAEIENGEYRVLSAVDCPPKECLEGHALCHCDGLYLSHCSFNKEAYILFNPSNRTCKTLCYPYPDGCLKPLQFGICYDPWVKDYKVVIGDYYHYAVFYCKTNSWNDRKETNEFFCNNFDKSCPFRVSFYWVFPNTNPNPNCRTILVVRFDGRDEKFRMVATIPPDSVDDVRYTHPIDTGDSLCSFPEVPATNELVALKTVGYGGEWMKVKVKLQLIVILCDDVRPPCLNCQNKSEKEEK